LCPTPGPNLRHRPGDSGRTIENVSLGPLILVLVDDLLVQHENAEATEQFSLSDAGVLAGWCDDLRDGIAPWAIGERYVQLLGNEREIAAIVLTSLSLSAESSGSCATPSPQ